MTVKDRVNSRHYNVMILKSFSLVFLFVLAAKVIGALKEVALADRYGADSLVDAYAFAFNIANWPVTVASMCSGTILIPVLLQLSFDQPSARPAIIRSMIAWALLIAIVTATGVGAFIWEAATMASESGKVEMAHDLRVMALPLAMIIPSGVLCALLSAKLMSGRNYISTLFEAIPSLVLIMAVIAASGYISGPYLIGGTMAVGFLLLLMALIAAQPKPYRELLPSFRGSRLLLRMLGRDMLVILFAQVIFSFAGTTIDQLAASKLPSEANAVLGYANRLIMLITSLGATTIGRATLPVFAAARLEGENEERGLAQWWAAITFALGLAGAIIGYAAAPLGVGILFHHGRFDASDLQAVSSTLRYGVWQLPFYFGGLIFMQAVASQRRYAVLLISNSVAAGIKIALVVLLARTLGLPGIMISTCVMYAASFSMLGFVVLFPNPLRRCARAT